MATQPGTNKQIPDHAILDFYNKQAYLGQQFVYAIGDLEIGSTSETPLFAISNPVVAASAFPSGYLSLFVNLSKIVCLTASQSVVARIYIGPTTSAGTSETPLNVRPQSPTTSIATLLLSPTASANGNLVDVLCASPGLPDKSSSLFILDPGKSLLVTAQTTSNSTFIGAVLGWQEI